MLVNNELALLPNGQLCQCQFGIDICSVDVVRTSYEVGPFSAISVSG